LDRSLLTPDWSVHHYEFPLHIGGRNQSQASFYVSVRVSDPDPYSNLGVENSPLILKKSMIKHPKNELCQLFDVFFSQKKNITSSAIQK
jgi:hypothetical protein